MPEVDEGMTRTSSDGVRQSLIANREMHSLVTKSLGQNAYAGLRLLFLSTSVVVLFITASAKLLTTIHPAPILFLPDPVFSFLTTQALLVIAALLELSTALIIVVHSNKTLKLTALTWLSSLFLLYRFASRLLSRHEIYCPCLGTIGKSIGIDDSALNRIMLAIAITLLIGSISMLVFQKGTARNAYSLSNAKGDHA
jgi:hypothetical protein